jgi:uncharacterized protein (TIGR00159 family)
MLEGLLHLFARRPLREIVVDVIDIALVTYFSYRALVLLRGTRAMQMGTGLGVVFLLYVAAKWAGFVTLFTLLSTLLSSIILIIVVVFQNDIRRGLMRLGVRSFFGGTSRQQETRVIDEVVAAVMELARARTGALICFEQDASLDEFVVAAGTELDAVVQSELLVTLFVPDKHNKLHDGAVVIRNFRIARAGALLPMADTRVLDKALGTRHRAALGITEETDAVVVVVSEERGTISYCFNGNIVSNLDGNALKQVLLGHFGGQRRRKRGAVRAQKPGAFRITVPPPPPEALPVSSLRRTGPPPPASTPPPSPVVSSVASSVASSGGPVTRIGVPGIGPPSLARPATLPEPVPIPPAKPIPAARSTIPPPPNVPTVVNVPPATTVPTLASAPVTATSAGKSEES